LPTPRNRGRYSPKVRTGSGGAGERPSSRPHPRRRSGELAPALAPEQASRPIGQLCLGGVDLSRAPRAAVEDFLSHRKPPPQEARLPRRRGRGRGSRRQPEHCVDAGEGG
jgi:hypothetical protein